MKLFNATLRDYFYKRRKCEIDPNFAFKNHVKSSDSTSGPTLNYQPVEIMTSDPILQLARSEESFYAQGLNSGFQIFQRGHVDSAADEQNLRAFQESRQLPHHNSGEEMVDDPMRDPRAPGYPSIYDRPAMHDPRVMPPVVSNPLNAFQVMNMCMGGY